MTLGPALIATKDDGKASAPPFTNSTSPDPTPTTVPEPTPTVITFPGSGVRVRSESDLAKLGGTSEEFKSFIGAVLIMIFSLTGAVAYLMRRK